MYRDLRRAARTREAHCGAIVRADDRGVDVAVAVDLRAAQESDFDAAVLEEELEHIGHAAHHERSGHERRIADRHREPFGHRADGSGLVDQRQARRVGPARQVAREIRETDTDEHYLAVAQLPRRDRRHHLVGGVSVSTRSSPRRTIALWL